MSKTNISKLRSGKKQIMICEKGCGYAYSATPTICVVHTLYILYDLSFCQWNYKPEKWTQNTDHDLI